ncbi:MAG: type II toxin-antitoxin system PemK/MazF family toxin [Chloroflexi bacterium]|nr:type II toxin-antitoxin system PemK/MazF family toxin [Chloroflexota bacterium]
MRRGEIWTAAGGGDYTGRPRPVVVLQDDRFDATDSITVCPLTTDPDDLPLFRILIEPSDRNGLDETSRIMADKVSSVRRSRLGTVLGQLDWEDMVRLNRAVITFLGLAESPRR